MKKTIITTREKTFINNKDTDHVICPICLASNRSMDLKCRNCGKRLKKWGNH